MKTESEGLSRAVPPYPDNHCKACESGEKTLTAPKSSVLGPSMPVHYPSGNVCAKWCNPEHLRAIKEMHAKRKS